MERKSMNRHLLVFSFLGLLIIGGLVAGIFAGSIQKALTVPPMAQAKMNNAPVAKPAGGTPNAVPVMPAQMPTTVLAQDTFHRADQTLWGTASDGRTWGGDANNNNLQVFSITGATGVISKGQGTFNALLGPLSGNVEVLLAGSVNRFAAGANLGAVLRWTDDNNWYKALIDGTHLSILRRVNGVSTIIGTKPFKAQGNVQYMLRFRAIGATIFTKAWRSDQPEPANWMVTVTDTTLTSGQVGVRVVVQNTVTIKVASFTATTASSSM
jgi:hypothetical protein